MSVRRSRLVAAAALLFAATGCAGAEQAAVERTATAFGAAVTGTDLVGACALLAPATRAELELAEGQPCPQALRQVPLSAGPIVETSVWGGAAQVRTGADTLFLTRTGQGWRVSAAGCQSRGEAPYHCRVVGP